MRAGPAGNLPFSAEKRGKKREEHIEMHREERKGE